jgi:hypothetical protein
MSHLDVLQAEQSADRSGFDKRITDGQHGIPVGTLTAVAVRSGLPVEVTMGRKALWIVGAAVGLALYAAPAHAQVSVSVGVGGPWFGAGVVFGGPVYAGAPYYYPYYSYPYPYYYPYPVYSYPYPVYRYSAYPYRYPARYGRAYYGGRQPVPYYRGAPGRYYNNGPGGPAQYRRGAAPVQRGVAPAQRGNVPAPRGNAQAVRVARQR